MNTAQAFDLFEKMIAAAADKLQSFTLETKLSAETKVDKTIVTQCDQAIDNTLTAIAKSAGLSVVSEEGEHVLDIVKSGNYITIDPIDGTLGYIDYVNYALENGGIQTFGQKDLGASHDFCLLLGIVENGIPAYGACYNYVTQEKIFIDGNDKTKLQRTNDVRGYKQPYAVYVDQRPGDFIEDELKSIPDVEIITQAALGLKSLYTVLDPHEAAITAHRVQVAGLWDIMPAAVAARAFGGVVYDDKGDELKLQDYIILPGKGSTIIRGNKFEFIVEKLRASAN